MPYADHVIYRKEEIMRLCAGKRVLHLGFIQHHDLYEKKIAENDWLHEKIAGIAKSVVGLDYLKEDVDIIRKKYGYECYYADVTDTSLMECLGDKIGQFDVVVCGELIEHVANPGLMLKNIRPFLNSRGRLIVTTPNPWCYRRIRLMMAGCLEKSWLNKEHVAWYSYQTLYQILERYGYQEVCYDFYRAENPYEEGIKAKIKKKLLGIIIREQRYLEDGLFFVAQKI